LTGVSMTMLNECHPTVQLCTVQSASNLLIQKPVCKSVVIVDSSVKLCVFS